MATIDATQIVKMPLRLGALICFMISMPAVAADPVQCSAVENARERLACFDRLYPGDVVPRPTTETATGPSAERPGTPSESGAPAVESQPPPQRPAVPDAATAPREASGGILDWDDKVDITAVVKAIHRRDKQKMVFLLDNDETWIQSKPRILPIKTGDIVTIKSARMGGYILRNQNNTATRVQRLE